jgi:nicotinamidase-related amidase
MTDPRRTAPGSVGLLLIDVVNPLDFDGAEALAPQALKAADPILDLRRQADALGVPVIYVNDNYGHWTSERSRIVECAAAASLAAGLLVPRLAPRPGDAFVIKPEFSGFYATSLPSLLPALGVSRLVLAGFAADICVLFTAADAHMRQYDLWVPCDAVASETGGHQDWALEIMRKSMSAETRPTTELDLASWVHRRPPAGTRGQTSPLNRRDR